MSPSAVEMALEWRERRHKRKMLPDLPSSRLIQEQRGLKLESQKEPVYVLVIDHAEHPSED
jgi:uncharacterized protein (TIGR03435 family)